jgi:hypothetical protein
MDYEDTALYARGMQYKQFGEMLMDEKTTIADLSAFAFENGFDLEFRIGSDEELLDDPQRLVEEEK